MKVELCVFSGYKIYPGHGKRIIKSDGKSYQFLDAKSAKLSMAKKNPRKIHWTVLYRRKHKKGLTEEVSKKRTRKNTKFQKAVVGATLTDILAKRNQVPEVRQAQRDQAIRAAKEKNKAKAAVKRTTKPPQSKSLQKQKAPKQVQKSQPRVGGKR